MAEETMEGMTAEEQAAMRGEVVVEEGAGAVDAGLNAPAEGQKPATPPEAPQAQGVKMVDKRALDEERMKRREYKKQLDETNARLAEMQQRLKELEKPREVAPQPDPMLEPEAYARSKIAALEQEIQGLKVVSQADLEANTERLKATQVMDQFQPYAKSFAEENPGFNAAMEGLRTARLQELRWQGHDAAQANAIMTKEYVNLVQTAIAEDENPAERLYALAKGRGLVPPPGSNDAAKVRKGQENASKVRGTGDGAKGDLTLDDIARIGETRVQPWKPDKFDSDFDRLISQMKRGAAT